KPQASFAGPRRGRVERPVDATLGILPTMLELAGLPPPDDVHGSSVLGAGPDEAPVFQDNDWIRAVRSGRWKLIRIGEEAAEFPEVQLRGDPPELLFDLATDPGERVNLAEREPAKARALRTLLETRFAPIVAEVRARDAEAAA